jgi:hypothetical protein
MALDHYVSQVHLKRFYSPSLDELMHATRKSDLKTFTPRSNDVCRTDEGNTNDFLTEPRAIEEFLKTVERKYNDAVTLLETGRPNNEAIYVVAGFLSYLLTCTPAAMRMNANLVEEHIEAMTKAADAKAAFEPPPSELAGDSLTELLDSGGIKVVVDRKVPQAVGIATILSHVASFGNSSWEILVNNNKDCPFFTSDFPVANEQSENQFILNRVVPLTPTLAVRIKPDINHNAPDFSFENFSYVRRHISRQEAIEINRSLVRSAEDTVFYSEAQGWVSTFVEKNRNHRMETQEVNPGTGPLKHYRQVAAKFDRAAQQKEQPAKMAAPISRATATDAPSGVAPRKGMTFSTWTRRGEPKPLK